MICPFCDTMIPLPLPKEPAICEGCGREFRPVSDVGWFAESIVVYVHEP